MNSLTQISDTRMPPDDSVWELAREARLEAEYQEYLECGHLPGGKDASHVDAMLLEEMPECLHDLSVASEARYGRDELMLMIASRIASKRETIVMQLIAEALDEA